MSSFQFKWNGLKVNQNCSVSSWIEVEMVLSSMRVKTEIALLKPSPVLINYFHRHVKCSKKFNLPGYYTIKILERLQTPRCWVVPRYRKKNLLHKHVKDMTGSEARACGRDREQQELFRGWLGDETYVLKSTALREDFIQFFHQHWAFGI